MVLASLTHLVATAGPPLVFVLLMLDAVLPVGGELPMLVSGAVASGAIGHGTSLVGIHFAGPGAYVVLALAGTLGYLAGSLGGWAIGRRGGRELVERHGRWMHLGPERMARAERWFAKYGTATILFGRVTPLVRSLISVPAGVLGARLGSYTALTAIAAAVWCFGLAAIGWALGEHWDVVHRAFRYLDVLAVLALVAAAGVLLVRRRRLRAA